MTLPGYSKQALTDLPTSNLIAGANFFVINEGRWYYCDGVQWIKHSENLSNTQIQNFTNNITAVSNLSDYIDSSLSNQNTTINGLQNQITNFNSSVNGTLSNHQSMITALQDAIENINSGSSNNIVDYTELLLKFNGSNNSSDFIDDSSNNYLVVPNNNPIISTDNYKYGGSSLSLNGLNYLALPSFYFKGSWTIETWFKPTQNSGNTCLFSQSTGGFTNSICLSLVDGYLQYYDSSYSSSSPLLQSSDFVSNQWYHVAIVRDKLKFYLYLNGILQDDMDYSGFNFNSSHLFCIGLQTGTARFFNGYIDNFRISKKAIYTPTLYPIGFNTPGDDFNVSPIVTVAR